MPLQRCPSRLRSGGGFLRNLEGPTGRPCGAKEVVVGDIGSTIVFVSGHPFSTSASPSPFSKLASARQRWNDSEWHYLQGTLRAGSLEI